jgi:hypothetical protein
MSAPQGIVEIEIARIVPAEEPPEGEEAEPGSLRTVYARLLTPELQQLIERQNVDCADINSMKWPLFGLSRHATCKILLLQRDLMNLLCVDNGDWRNIEFRSNKDGFRIWFIVGSKQQSLRSCFNRMHIADIQPLMVSAFGKTLEPLPPDPPPEPGQEVPPQPPVPWGEAMYIVTFKCDRWAARGNRAIGVIRDTYSRSWDPSAQLDYSPSLDKTCADVVDEAITGKLASTTSGFWRLYRTDVDGFIDDAEVDLPEYGSYKGTPSGMGNFNRKPITNYVDEICSRTGASVSYRPNVTVLADASIPGRYAFGAISISSDIGLDLYLISYGKDIIAGCIKHDASLPDPDSEIERGDRPTAAEFPNVIRLSTKPNDIIVSMRWEQKADGRPPDVFRTLEDPTASPDSASWFQSNALNNPFSNTPNFTFFKVGDSDVIQFEPSDTNGEKVEHGDAYKSFYNADTWTRAGFTDRSLILSANTLIPPFDSTIDKKVYWSLANRVEAKYKSGVCDLWLRSWIMPDYPWPGANWIELRLQLDGKGFPFPVTHLYGDINDPLLGPVSDEGQHEIEPSGMVQTWRGEDGRLRVHVGAPFGIPCLLRIVGNESIGDNAWKYTAKIVYRDDTASAPISYHGGLRKFAEAPDPDPEIIAYNLCEAANNAGFAGPGYKIPLVQDGFNVLPIGQDRDGVLHDVVVQAMLYVHHYAQSHDHKIQAYFCLHNAIDGECDTSAFVEPTYDGGTYTGGV